MKRLRTAILGGLAVMALGLPMATAQGADSSGMRLLASYKTRAVGPMSFEGRWLVRDAETENGGFLMSRLAADARLVRDRTTFDCPGSGGRTISRWKGFVIASGYLEGGPCGDGNSGNSQAGIRIVDVRDPARPQQVAFLEGSCEIRSPGHALLPLGDVVYIYDVWELPFCSAPEPEPMYMKVIRLDADRPGGARAVSTPATGPVEGCDRLTVHVKRRLLACSAINRVLLFDLTDPANPQPRGIAALNAGFLWEASFTWDGHYLVMGQYIGGPDSCDLIIVDVRDPDMPVEAGRLDPPRTDPGECPSPFSVSVLPTRDPQRYLAVVGWNQAGITVIDFSDPTRPKEIAFYEEDVTFAYWYNGRVYAGAGRRLLVLKLARADRDTMNYFRRFYPHTQYADFKS